MTTTDINRHINCLSDSAFPTPKKTPRHFPKKKEPEIPPPTSKTPFEIIRDFFTSTPKHLPTFKDKDKDKDNKAAAAVRSSKIKEITNPVQKQNLIKELSNTKVTPVQDFFNPTPKHVPMPTPMPMPSTGIRINASSLQTPKHLNKSLMSFGGTGKPQSQNLSYNGTMKSIKQH